MQNWVEGKLKIRGKPEDIKRWVEECLHCYTTNWLGDGAHTELVEGEIATYRLIQFKDYKWECPDPKLGG